MQPLGTDEAEIFVDSKRRNVVDLCFQRDLIVSLAVHSQAREALWYLIRISGNHCINSHAYKLGGDAFAAVLGLSGQHGDVASHRSAAMGLELADDDSNQLVVLIESLRTAVSLTPRS